MKSLVLILLALVLMAGCASEAEAQVCVDGSCGTSAGYAARMNAGRFFRHDRSWGGAEVIYRSSGTATEAEARQYWMNSPPHRRLLVSGVIQDVACVGGVCVGRSIQAAANVTQPFMQGVRNSVSRQPLKRIAKRLKCCR